MAGDVVPQGCGTPGIGYHRMPRGPMLPSLCVNAQKVHSCCKLFAVFCISCRLEHLLRAGCPHALYPVPAPLCKGLGLKEKDLFFFPVAFPPPCFLNKQKWCKQAAGAGAEVHQGTFLADTGRSLTHSLHGAVSPASDCCICRAAFGTRNASTTSFQTT